MPLHEKHPLRTLPIYYDGTRFRSRLEAEWALYFDVSETEWAYLPDAFNFDGEWYAPGFRIVIDGNAVWAEVKSEGRDFEKAEIFAERGERIVMLAGRPEAKPYRLLFGKGEFFSLRFVDFSPDYLRNDTVYVSEDGDEEMVWNVYLLGGASGPNGDRDAMYGAADISIAPRYCDAVAAVHRARFERVDDCEVLCV